MFKCLKCLTLMGSAACQAEALLPPPPRPYQVLNEPYTYGGSFST